MYAVYDRNPRLKFYRQPIVYAVFLEIRLPLYSRQDVISFRTLCVVYSCLYLEFNDASRCRTRFARHDTCFWSCTVVIYKQMIFYTINYMTSEISLSITFNGISNSISWDKMIRYSFDKQTPVTALL